MYLNLKMVAGQKPDHYALHHTANKLCFSYPLRKLLVRPPPTLSILSCHSLFLRMATCTTHARAQFGVAPCHALGVAALGRGLPPPLVERAPGLHAEPTASFQILRRAVTKNLLDAVRAPKLRSQDAIRARISGPRGDGVSAERMSVESPSHI